MNNVEKIMGTIKWVNDTFVPWGMKPIEDLPEAVPGEGNTCVMAKVLKDGFVDMQNVHVGSTYIDFNISNSMENTDMWDNDGKLIGAVFPMGEVVETLQMPQEIQMFIHEFDKGCFPELIDEELTIAEVGEWEAHNTFKIGCTGEDCFFCNSEKEWS